MPGSRRPPSKTKSSTKVASRSAASKVKVMPKTHSKTSSKTSGKPVKKAGVKPSLTKKPAVKKPAVKKPAVKKPAVKKTVKAPNKSLLKKPDLKKPALKKVIKAPSLQKLKPTNKKETTKQKATSPIKGKTKNQAASAPRNSSVKTSRVETKIAQAVAEALPPRAIAVRRDPFDRPVDKKKSVIRAPQHLPAPEEPQTVSDPGFLTNDDVFDETDHAQWQQLREMADIQSRARLLNKPEVHPDFDGIHCVECDDEIPALRLSMYKVRCVDCQNEIEQQSKRESRERSYTAPVKKDDPWTE